uniref:Serine racemase n=1 Tax=Timema bartmani TaxID=61472 RepID=A0A7R9ENK4_9NEOP|nr:unnamed protein product [Timema bartmani]
MIQAALTTPKAECMPRSGWIEFKSNKPSGNRLKKKKKANRKLVYKSHLSQVTGMEVYLKKDFLQYTGSGGAVLFYFWKQGRRRWNEVSTLLHAPPPPPLTHTHSPIYKSLTLAEKVEVIKKVEKGLKNKSEMAKAFETPPNTLSTFLKNKQKILSNENESGQDRKRLRGPESPYQENDGKTVTEAEPAIDNWEEVTPDHAISYVDFVIVTRGSLYILRANADSGADRNVSWYFGRSITTGLRGRLDLNHTDHLTVLVHRQLARSAAGRNDVTRLAVLRNFQCPSLVWRGTEEGVGDSTDTEGRVGRPLHVVGPVLCSTCITKHPFKERGARYALLMLSDEKKMKGVISASLGNHALALCYHGKDLKIPVTVVMPIVAPIMKIQSCRQHGASVVVQGDDMGEAKRIAMQLAKERELTYINGYDHPHIMAGQGTLGLEIVEQVPNIDAVVVPVGGGGLIAGVALAVGHLSRACKIKARLNETNKKHTYIKGNGHEKTHFVSKCVEDDSESLFKINETELVDPSIMLFGRKYGEYSKALSSCNHGRSSTIPLDVGVKRFLLDYRHVPHATTGISLAQALMERQLRNHLDLLRASTDANRVQQAKAKQRAAYAGVNSKTSCYYVGDQD